MLAARASTGIVRAYRKSKNESSNGAREMMMRPMFERWKYERRQQKIEKKLYSQFFVRKNEGKFDNAFFDESDSPLSPDGEVRLKVALDEYNREAQRLRMWFDKLCTDRLCREAVRLDIELPRGDELWEKSPLGGILKRGARGDLRRKIDDEKSRRRDVTAWWWKTVILPAMTFLIGIIGALTGLVVVLKRH